MSDITQAKETKSEARNMAFDAFEARHPRLKEWTKYRRFWEAVWRIIGREVKWGELTAAEWRKVAREMEGGVAK